MTRHVDVKRTDPSYHVRRSSQLQSSFYARLIRPVLFLLADIPISLLRRVGREINRWWRRRQSLRKLRELDPRTLKDIGLSRGEFDTVADYYADHRCYPRGTTSSCARPRDGQ